MATQYWDKKQCSALGKGKCETNVIQDNMVDLTTLYYLQVVFTVKGYRDLWDLKKAETRTVTKVTNTSKIEGIYLQIKHGVII